ncbi:MAG: ATP-dependent dethiobiotin synthetase BioD [Acidimicrobiales bacterium]
MTSGEGLRPDRVVLITGTGTEVGKTWVGCRLAVALRDRDLTVAARKPVLSYDPGDDLTGSDAALLARATDETPEAICPPHRWYPVAMAPPMAADVLGRPRFTIGELVAEIVWPRQARVGLVEAAGGVLSPLAEDGDSVTLAEHLDPDLVVLVADAGLGTINAVRLAVGVLVPWPTTVVLNRYEPLSDLHRRNRTWLVDREHLDVVISAEQILPALLA